MTTADGLTSCPQCGKRFPSTVRICPDDGTVLEHTTPAPTQAGQVLDGKYRLDALLAEGGMGAVYRATHVMLGKTVAIKLIRSAIVASPEIVRRFQREARAATALNHPNIVTVYDLGQTPDGTLYIAMEFIDGPSLKAVIQSGRAIPPARTISILRQVASALSTAHRHNIVHRDLKPHNIMLAEGSDGSEVAKLVDFGIAKTFDEATQLTNVGSALGTPYYMSPEQIDGRNVDARADIYALGIILYEMLVGEVPFADQSTPAVLVKQLKERPIRPSLRNAAVPPALEEIALRCLEKEPEQRYQTADAFAAALNEAAATIDASAPAADVTLPTPRPTTAAPLPPPGAASSEPTFVTPVKTAEPPPAGAMPASAAASIAPSASPAGVPAFGASPASPRPSPTDTKPTVPQSVGPPPPSMPARQSSSIVPLIGVAAVLLLLAGGYIWWSDHQTGTSTTSAPASPVEPPVTTPASAQPPEPSAAADASKISAPPAPPGPPPPPPPPGAPPDRPASAAAAATPSAPASSLPAATKAATNESQAVKTPPPAAVASATKAAAAAAANASRSASAPPRSGGSRTSEPATASAAPPATPTPRDAGGQPAAAPMIPENAAVAFRCGGAAEVCASLNSAVHDALDKAGFRVVTSPDRADVLIGAMTGVLDEKASRQFGQTFNTRTYQIELSGEAPRFGDSVSMPAATTVSFDATVGRERLEEKSRLVASDIAERVRAYVKKKRGGV
jgi:eukaryotic-like serine/threonine-protein kinase